MDEIIFFEQTKSVSTIIMIIELFFRILFTFYTVIKFINIENIKTKNKIIISISSVIIAICGQMVRNFVDLYYCFITVAILMIITNIIIFRKDILYTITITILSLAINEALYYVAGFIAFIPNAIFRISNDFIAAVTILVVYAMLIYFLFKIRKIKYGINFLQEKLQNPYFNILIVNICLMILFLRTIYPYTVGLKGGTVYFNIAICLISIIVLIKQSFNMVYKQNLLEKDLAETKSELEDTKKELEQANKDNIEISGKIHTLNHRQKSLQHQLDKLTKSGNKDTKYLKEQLDSISEEMYQEPDEVELTKTDIPAVDTMLDYMQSECKENNIKFELQVEGNIHYMVNNLIPENDLEILLADHIKDAIIAINHSDNSNRSILIRLGKIDECYGLHIYDSGIEFTKEVLEKLGKEPITTHKDEGGTGMGFMNTFNTLNKTKASLTIKEIGEPCIDNYTKVLIIRFDNENQFKVESYKSELEYIK